MPEENNTPQKENSGSIEFEKLEFEKIFKTRELDIKEREQHIKEAELNLKKEERKSSSWKNPLIVSIMAASVAALGNAYVSLLNANSLRSLLRP